MALLEGIGPPVVAVIPFDNLSGDEYWTRLADGLSADIIVDLARYPDLAVIARQTMIAYKGRRDDVRSIGRELNADYVLEGTLQAAGHEVRICGATRRRRYGGCSLDGPLRPSARRSVCDAGQRHGKRHQCPCEFAAANSQACGAMRPGGSLLRICGYDCYLLGVEACHKLTPASNREAIRLQSRAVELDPGLARAWAPWGSPIRSRP